MRIPHMGWIGALGLWCLAACQPVPLAPISSVNTNSVGAVTGAKPTPTPQGSNPSPGATFAPTTAPSAGGGASPFPIGGQDPSPAPTDDPARHDTVDITTLRVSTVSVSPTDITLNLPPQNPNLGSAGFVTSMQLDARVQLDNGMFLDGDLVWTSANPELVTVDTAGGVPTVRSAGGARVTTAPVVVTGRSRKDPSRSVTVRVTLVDDAAAVIDLI